MRILIGATRALLSAVTTAHIAAIRLGVAAADRAHGAVVRATDATCFARDVAHAAAKEADALVDEAYVVEARSARVNLAHRAAAQEEISSLRRGVSL